MGEEIHRARFGKAFDGDGSSEALDRLARLGIQRMQEEGRRDHINDIATVDIGVGDALAMVLPHGVLPPERLRLDP